MTKNPGWSAASRFSVIQLFTVFTELDMWPLNEFVLRHFGSREPPLLFTLQVLRWVSCFPPARLLALRGAPASAPLCAFPSQAAEALQKSEDKYLNLSPGDVYVSGSAQSPKFWLVPWAPALCEARGPVDVSMSSARPGLLLGREPWLGAMSHRQIAPELLQEGFGAKAPMPSARREPNVEKAKVFQLGILALELVLPAVMMELDWHRFGGPGAHWTGLPWHHDLPLHHCLPLGIRTLVELMLSPDPGERPGLGFVHALVSRVAAALQPPAPQPLRTRVRGTCSICVLTSTQWRRQTSAEGNALHLGCPPSPPLPCALTTLGAGAQQPRHLLCLPRGQQCLPTPRAPLVQVCERRPRHEGRAGAAGVPRGQHRPLG